MSVNNRLMTNEVMAGASIRGIGMHALPRASGVNVNIRTAAVPPIYPTPGSAIYSIV